METAEDCYFEWTTFEFTRNYFDFKDPYLYSEQMLP